jgi:predicted AAA+ superfamily ATPase
VSYNELGQLCGLDPKTVEKYVMVLEQSYIVFRLGSFSRNLRNELKFSRKIYSYDNGILSAYEFKWNPKRKAAVPSSFSTAYPEISFSVISRDNIEDFILHPTV